MSSSRRRRMLLVTGMVLAVVTATLQGVSAGTTPAVVPNQVLLVQNTWMGVATGVSMGGGPLSVAMWVFLREAPPEGAILFEVGQSAFARPQLSLSFVNGGAIQFVVDNAAQGPATRTLVVTATTIPINAWVHIAAVQSGSTGTIYVNGLATAQDKLDQLAAGMRPVVHIMAGVSANAPRIDGLVDDFYLVNGALTAANVAQLIPLVGTLVPSNALLRFTFDSPSSPLAYFNEARIWDQSGNNNNATLLCDFQSCVVQSPAKDRFICGDGRLAYSEVCDDGNLQPGDGCSATCQVEAGFVCNSGAPGGTSLCVKATLLMEDTFESGTNGWTSIVGTKGQFTNGFAYRYSGTSGLRVYQAGRGFDVSKPPTATALNMKLWLRADDLGTKPNGATVTEWKDFSGFNYSATPVDKITRNPVRTITPPTVQLNVLNGKPVVRFASETDGLQVKNTLSLAAPYTAFIIARNTPLHSGYTFASATTSWILGPRGNTGDFYPCTTVAGGNGVSGEWHTYSATAGGGTSVFYRNGQRLGNIASNGCNPGVLGFGVASVSGNPAFADVAEVLVYNTVLSDDNRLIAEAYLREKWFPGAGDALLLLLQRAYAANNAPFVSWGTKTLGPMGTQSYVHFAYNLRTDQIPHTIPLIVVFRDASVQIQPQACSNALTDCVNHMYYAICFNAAGALFDCDDTFIRPVGVWQHHTLDVRAQLRNKYGPTATLPTSLSVTFACLAGNVACEAWVDDLRYLKATALPACSQLAVSAGHFPTYQTLMRRTTAATIYAPLDEPVGQVLKDIISSASITTTGTLGVSPLVPAPANTPATAAVSLTAAQTLTINFGSIPVFETILGIGVEAWVSLTSLPTTGTARIFAVMDAASNAFLLVSVDNGGKLLVTMVDDAQNLALTTTVRVFTANTPVLLGLGYSPEEGFNHIVVNKDEVQLYMVSSPTTTALFHQGLPLQSLTSLVVGGGGVGMIVDEVAVFPQTLPQQLVALHYSWQALWYANQITATSGLPAVTVGGRSLLPTTVNAGTLYVAELNPVTLATVAVTSIANPFTSAGSTQATNLVNSIKADSLVALAYAPPNTVRSVDLLTTDDISGTRGMYNWGIPSKLSLFGPMPLYSQTDYLASGTWAQAVSKCQSYGKALCPFDQYCNGRSTLVGDIDGVAYVPYQSTVSGEVNTWLSLSRAYPAERCFTWQELKGSAAPLLPTGTAQTYFRCCDRFDSMGHWVRRNEAKTARYCPYCDDYWTPNYNGWYQQSWACGTDHPTSNDWYQVRCDPTYQRGTYNYLNRPSAYKWTDYEVSATFVSNIRGTGIMFRFQDPNNYYRFYMMFTGTGADSCLHFMRRSNGVNTVIASRSGYQPYKANSRQTIRVRVVGNRMIAYVNGQVALDATDANPPALLASGTIALYTFFSYTYWRNLEVTAVTAAAPEGVTRLITALHGTVPFGDNMDQTAFVLIGAKNNMTARTMQQVTEFGGGGVSVNTVFNCRNQTFSIPENSQIGTPMPIPVAVHGTPAQFRIEDAYGTTRTGVIAVDSATGQIEVADKLDYETKKSYSLWVSANAARRFDSGWFVMRSDGEGVAYREVTHGLGVNPALLDMDVQLRIIAGPSKGMIFRGEGAAAMEDDDNSLARYGGIVYGFNGDKVRVWAPAYSMYGGGSIVMLQHGWGGSYVESNYVGELNSAYSHAADVRVQARVLEAADFDSGWIRMHAHRVYNSYREFLLDWNVLPDTVKVYARVTDGPNAGFIFPGVTQPMAYDDYQDYGGVSYSYTSAYVRVWLPHWNGGKKGSVCSIRQGWGQNANTPQCSSWHVDVRVLAWKPQQPPVFTSDWLSLLVLGQAYFEVPHPLQEVPERVSMEVRSTATTMYFSGSGMPRTCQYYSWMYYGGAITAVDGNNFRVWSGSQWPYNGDMMNQRGYSIIAGYDGWAGELYRDMPVLGEARFRAWYRQNEPSEMTLLQINVRDVLEPPTVQDLVVSVKENSAAGTVVGTVGTGATGTTFTIVGGNVDYAFRVVAATGQILVNNTLALDFETRPSFALIIGATDSLFSVFATARISLINVNDPVQMVPKFVLHVDENSRRNAYVGAPIIATDSDIGQSILFTIVAGNIDDAFKIGACSGQVRVNNPVLNFENATIGGVYNLTVVATDDGVPPSNATTWVQIFLNDVNDPPHFLEHEIYRQVPERSAVGFKIGAPLPAVDEDRGQTLTFVIEVGDPTRMFNITHDGWLEVASPNLDYEGVITATGMTTDSFRLRVLVEDNAYEPEFDRAFVNIQVLDENDPPTMNPTVFQIPEGTKPFTLVGTPLTSADQDANDPHTYRLVPPSKVFNLTLDGQLSVAAGAVLDYETTPRYVLTVRCTDSGGSPPIRYRTTPLSVDSTITVLLSNVNEPPTLLPSTFHVDENVRIGTIVGIFNSTDPDGDKLFYVLSSVPDNAFQVAPTVSNALATSGPIDYERKNSYVMNVIAFDRDPAGQDFAIALNASAKMTVLVNNLNDPPVLSCNASLAPEWVRNVGFNGIFGLISDPNPPVLPESVMSFGTISSESSCRLACQQTSGCAAYVLFSNAYDRVNWRGLCYGRTAAANVLVDEQDDGVVTGVRVDVCQGYYVPENVPVGTVVGAGLTITDQDGNTVQVRLTQASDIFAIAAVTGVVTVAHASLNYENINRYLLPITITDNGVPPASANYTLVVHVTDVNEPPILNPATYSVMERDTAGDTFQPPMTFLDPDANQVHTFSLLQEVAVGGACAHNTLHGSTPFFAIDASTGVLRLARFMSLTAPCVLAVLAKVSDGALFSTANATINLVNVNNRPDIYVSSAVRAIPEMSPIGTQVMPPVVISDVDGDVLTVKILSIAPSMTGIAPFSIAKSPTNSSLAIVTVRRNDIDFETAPVFHLQLMVQDDGDGQLTDTAYLDIVITDVPEPPVVSATVTGNIAENAPVGVIVSSGVFYDGDNDILSFSLRGASASVFSVRLKAGTRQGFEILLARGPLDFETGPHNFTFTMDTTDGTFTRSSVVWIDVVDMPEPPIVQSVNFTVAENVPGGTIIGTVPARDPDAGDILYYYFTDGNWDGAFIINQATGEISVADFDPLAAVSGGPAGLDYEDYSSYRLSVAVEDRPKGFGGYKTPAVVFITITNLNDMTIRQFENTPQSPTRGGSTVRIRGTNMYSKRSLPNHITATYGPTGVEYTATGCVADRDPLSVYANNSLVVCQTVAGSGRGHIWKLTVDTQTATSSATTSYQPPAITSVAVDGVRMSTQGGQAVTIVGTDFGPVNGAPVAARYGPYTAQSCAVTVAHTTMVCISAPGIGANHTWVVTVDSQSSQPSTFPVVTSYRAPAISTVTSSGNLDTAGGEIVTLVGTDFGPLAVDMAASVPRPSAVYGGGGRWFTTSCDVVIAHVKMECYTVPGVGANQRWQVSLGGQSSVWSSQTTRYRTPVITAISGPGAAGGATSGGDQVFIAGLQLGPENVANVITWVRYGGRLANKYSALNCTIYTPHEMISCVTGPGTGKGHAWQVSIGDQMSGILAANTSYAPPFVTTFDGPAYPYAQTVGGETILVYGSNFGPSMATVSSVTYGPRPFRPANCSMYVPHSVLSCKMAPGAGAGHEWALVVDGQASSAPTSSYLPPVVLSVRLFPAGTKPVPAWDTHLHSISGASTDGAQMLVIDGTDFGPASPSYISAVTYGPAAYPALYRATNCFVSKPHTQLTCTTPRGVGQNLQLFVSIRGQISAPSAATFSYALPVVASVQPTHGRTAGGYVVTVTGTDFGGDSNPIVQVGSILYSGSLFRSKSVRGLTDILSVVIPEGVGINLPVSVYVQTDAPGASIATATRSNVLMFSYDDPIIERIVTEDTGITNLTRMSIYGDNFGMMSTSLVRISGNIADDIITFSHTFIQLNTTVSRGLVWVEVGDPVRASNQKEFSFLSPFIQSADYLQSSPAHPNMCPTAGTKSINQVLTIVGLYFGSVDRISETVVTIGTRGKEQQCSSLQLSVVPNVLNPSKSVGTIKCEVPAGQGTNIPVFVLRNSQQSQPLFYSYDPPSVTAVSPSSGWPTSGLQTSGNVATITLTGVNFGSNATVYVDKLAIRPQSQTHYSIVFAVPELLAGVTAFNHRIRVEVSGQMCTAPVNGTYQAPYIDSIVPSTGRTAGGSLFVLSGSNFGLSGQVTVDGVVCFCDPLRWSHSAATCKLPVGSGTNRLVQITRGNQQSNTVLFNYNAPTISRFSPVTGNTTGGTNITLVGDNFGASVAVGSVWWCLYRQCTGTTCTPIDCSNPSSFTQVPVTSILSYNHTVIRFRTPPGQGDARIMIQVSGQRVMSADPFSYNPPTLTFLPVPHGPPDSCNQWESFARFSFRRSSTVSSAPVYRKCCKPISLSIRGDNFGLNDLEIYFNNGDQDIKITDMCTTSSDSCVVPGACILKHDHTQILIRPPVGYGENRQVYVVVAQQRSAETLTFDYDPPDVSFINPTPYDAMGEPLMIYGKNFGIRSGPVSVKLAGIPCDKAEWFQDETGIVNDGLPIIQCEGPRAPVGFLNVSVTAANQTTFYSDLLELSEAICHIGFYGQPGELCLACPRGATCLGKLVEPTSDPSWWHANISNSDERCPAERRTRQNCPLFIPCDPPQACLGDNVCAEGYTNDRCKDCVKGQYYRVSGECIKCPNNAWMIALFFVVGAILLVIAGYVLSNKRINLSVVTIGVDYLQILALFAQSKVQWPAGLVLFFRYLSVFNINLELTAPECSIPEMTYDTKWFATMALPIAASVLILVVHLLQAFRIRILFGQKKTDLGTSSLMGVLLIMCYYMYLFVSRMTLEVFNCNPTDPPDGHTYMQAVFEPCFEEGSMQMKLLPWGIGGLIVYIFGFPAVVGWIFYKGRKMAKEDQLMKSLDGYDPKWIPNPATKEFHNKFSKLYYHFKPKYFFWILCILARKFGIAFTALMFRRNPGFQLAMAMLVLFFAYAAQVKHRPFLTASERPEVLKDHRRRLAQGSFLHGELDESLRTMQARIKETHKRKWGDDFSQPVENVAARVLFNLNTVEAALLFSATLVCLSGLMFQSGQFTSESQQIQRDGVTYLVILLIVSSVGYWLLVFATEVTGKMPICCRPKQHKFEKNRAAQKAAQNKALAQMAADGGEGDGKKEVQMALITNPLRSTTSAAVSVNARMAANMNEDAVSGARLPERPPNEGLWLLVAKKYRKLEAENAAMIASQREQQQGRGAARPGAGVGAVAGVGVRV